MHGEVAAPACGTGRFLPVLRLFSKTVNDTNHLICPKCRGSLRFEADGLFATCYDCLSLWVDTPALRTADPPIPKAAAVLRAVDAFDLAHASPTDLPCPGCRSGDLGMQRIRGVEVDWCFDCRGLFLDRGELTQLAESMADRSGVPVGSTRVVDTGRPLSWRDLALGIEAVLEVLVFLLGGLG